MCSAVLDILAILAILAAGVTIGLKSILSLLLGIPGLLAELAGLLSILLLIALIIARLLTLPASLLLSGFGGIFLRGGRLCDVAIGGRDAGVASDLLLELLEVALSICSIVSMYFLSPRI